MIRLNEIKEDQDHRYFQISNSTKSYIDLGFMVLPGKESVGQRGVNQTQRIIFLVAEIFWSSFSKLDLENMLVDFSFLVSGNSIMIMALLMEIV